MKRIRQISQPQGMRSAAQVYRWGCLHNRELPQPILNISFIRLAIGYFFYLIQATRPLF
jgi:hypothetical protein